MDYLTQDISDNYLHERISLWKSISNEYPEGHCVVGGSTALIIYDLIPYRKPGDLDLIVYLEEPNLSKDFYKGKPFRYETRREGFRLHFEGETHDFGNLKDLKLHIATTNLVDKGYKEVNQYNKSVLQKEINDIKVDIMVNFHEEEYYKANVFGNEVMLACAKSIINARMSYGISHKRFKETVTMLGDFVDWKNTFEYMGPLPF